MSDRLKHRLTFIRFDVELAGILLCIPFILIIAGTDVLWIMIAALLGAVCISVARFTTVRKDMVFINAPRPGN